MWDPVTLYDEVYHPSCRGHNIRAIPLLFFKASYQPRADLLACHGILVPRQKPLCSGGFFSYPICTAHLSVYQTAGGGMARRPHSPLAHWPTLNQLDQRERERERERDGGEILRKAEECGHRLCFPVSLPSLWGRKHYYNVSV